MPGDPGQQAARREAILEILKDADVGRQEELVAELKARGFEATQSSISRDLKEMGVAKIGARYLAPPGNHPARNTPFSLLARFVVHISPAGANLTVIRTSPGASQNVAVVLDESGWQEIVGTISGDDTIFVATATQRHQQLLLARLDQVFPGIRKS